MADKGRDMFTLLAVGDVSPNRDDPPSIMRYCRDTLRGAGILFGQMEAPLSDRGAPAFKPGVSTRLAAKNISALTKEEGAGFDVMSFACNHAMDYGFEAFSDTLDILRKNNIAVFGAGKDIAEARTPAILERDGTRVGFVGYLSIMYPGLMAQPDFPGCVPLRASHFYEQVDFQPGTAPYIITKLFPDDRKAMADDIKKLRPRVDILVASMHCGLHHVRASVAMYQKEAAYAAIDAGADLVLQHHAHILKGIEMYKGKAIFYGLGNFALEHHLPYPGKPGSWETRDRSFSLRKFYHLDVVPGYEKHGFHHDALKTLIAKAYVQDKKIQTVTYIPAYITPDLEPEVVTGRNPRAQEVFDYVKDISESEDLAARFSWDGEEVLISPPSGSQPRRADG